MGYSNPFYSKTSGTPTNTSPYGTSPYQNQYKPQQYTGSNQYYNSQPNYSTSMGMGSYGSNPYGGYNYNSQYPNYGSTYGSGAKTGGGFNTGYYTPQIGGGGGAYQGVQMYGTAPQNPNSKPPGTSTGGQTPPSNPNPNPNSGGPGQYAGGGDNGGGGYDDGPVHYNEQGQRVDEYGHPALSDDDDDDNDHRQQQGAGGGLGRDDFVNGVWVPYQAPPTSGEGPPLPSTPGATPGTPQGGGGWGMTWAQYAALTPEQRTAYDNWNAEQLGGSQFLQNQAQYSQDFTEAQYRDRAERERNLRNDLWQQGFSQQQIDEQVRQANLAQANNERDFGFNSGMANRQQTFAEQQGNQQTLQGWANINNQNTQFGQNLEFEKFKNQQQYGLAVSDQELQRMQFGEGQRQFNVGQGNWQAQFGEGQRQFNVGQGNWQAQFGEGQRQFNVGQGNEMARFGQTLDFEKLKNQQQYGLAVSDQELQRMQFGEGKRQFDVGQANQMNQFGQTMGFQYAQMGQQGQQFGQQLDFEKLKNQQQYGLAVSDQELQRMQFGEGQRQFDVGQGNEMARFGQTLGENKRQFNVQNALDSLKEQNDYAIRTGNLQLAQQTQDQANALANMQFGQGQYEFNVTQGNQMQQFGQQLDFERQKNQQQYGLALTDQEMKQQQFGQTFGLQQAQFGEEQRQFNAQQQQQMAIEQMRIAAQNQQATLAATGRYQPRSSRWLRAS